MAEHARDERSDEECVRFGALERQHAKIEDQLRAAALQQALGDKNAQPHVVGNASPGR